MARVKGGVHSNKRRKAVLSRTKGYRFGRSTKVKAAKEAIVKAGSYAFRDRKKNKTIFRQDWIIRMNAALRERGTTYSKFINALKNANIMLDRKSLASLAHLHSDIFDAIVKKVS